MDLLSNPCFTATNNLMARQAKKSELLTFFNRVCLNTTCPIHGQGGIATTLIRLMDSMSDEEFAQSLRRTMEM